MFFVDEWEFENKNKFRTEEKAANFNNFFHSSTLFFTGSNKSFYGSIVEKARNSPKKMWKSFSNKWFYCFFMKERSLSLDDFMIFTIFNLIFTTKKNFPFSPFFFSATHKNNKAKSLFCIWNEDDFLMYRWRSRELKNETWQKFYEAIIWIFYKCHYLAILLNFHFRVSGKLLKLVFLEKYKHKKLELIF